MKLPNKRDLVFNKKFISQFFGKEYPYFQPTSKEMGYDRLKDVIWTLQALKSNTYFKLPFETANVQNSNIV